MEEIWKPIKGYEGYEISSLGRVKSLKMKNEIIKKPHLNRDGYLYISFSNRGKSCTLKVHRLVCEHFCEGKTEERNHVDHIDGNKLNNVYTNLRWCTHHENILFAWETGAYNGIGENHAGSKLKENQVIEIKKMLKQKITCKNIAKQFGVTNWCIHDIKQGRIWKHVSV